MEFLKAIPETCMAIVRRLQEAGHEAVLTGGCVRDALIGRTPKDWDIATSARPEQVEKLFEKTYGVGRQFGIIVVLYDGEPYEVATFRGDGQYSDGRRPRNITFVPMREDVLRRDFTINAIMIDPVSGRVFDFVGGENDLKAGVVRTVGEPSRRFEEDKLRLLRAIRFTANLDFRIEDSTWDAVKAAARDITAISSERIYEELIKMLSCGHSHRAFRLLMDSGMMPYILPEIAALPGVEQPPQFHPEGDVWQHTLKILDVFDDAVVSGRYQDLSSDELCQLAWAALLHDIGKPKTFFRGKDRIHFNGHDTCGAAMSRDVMQRLKASRLLTDTVEYLIAGHMGLTHFFKMREATRIRHMSMPAFGLLLELFRMDCAASFGGLDLYDNISREFREFRARPIPVKPPVSGSDLIRLGYKPGPVFKQILDAVTDEHLEHPFESPDVACRWILANYPMQG